MKRVAAFFKNRFVMSFIGILALSLLIWFGFEYVKFGADNHTLSKTVRLILIVVLFAIWLTHLGLSPVTAHFLAGCVALIASAALAFIGAARLKPSALTPQVTIREVNKDIAAAKEMTS